jgi:hypothetical protein
LEVDDGVVATSEMLLASANEGALTDGPGF